VSFKLKYFITAFVHFCLFHGANCLDYTTSNDTVIMIGELGNYVEGEAVMAYNRNFSALA
jgi:hypothetical protein